MLITKNTDIEKKMGWDEKVSFIFTRVIKNDFKMRSIIIASIHWEILYAQPHSQSYSSAYTVLNANRNEIFALFSLLVVASMKNRNPFSEHYKARCGWMKGEVGSEAENDIEAFIWCSFHIVGFLRLSATTNVFLWI